MRAHQLAVMPVGLQHRQGLGAHSAITRQARKRAHSSPPSSISVSLYKSPPLADPFLPR